MREFRVIFIEFMKELKKRDVSIYAGNTSFFMLLSGIPLLIVLSRLVLRLGITEQDFATFFSSLAPASFASTIHNAIIGAYHLSASLLPLSVVVLIWSCAQGMISLMHGLNKVYDVHHDAGFLVLRLVGMMYTLLLMIMMLFIIAFILLGDDFFIKIGVMQSSIRTIYQWRFVILFVYSN
ncbi:MAG: YihY/virulence factor BrkB family protein [Erysipelotrichaceae bacterium]|nr:YihY/virulence factor BrkB family protein [Erysipelotrichaceae bacterium]